MPLFVPDGTAPALSAIAPGWLLQRGIRGLLLDLDDTIVPADSDVPDEAALAWVRAHLDVGPVVIVSNNRRRERVAETASLLGVPWIHLALKPLPFGLRTGLDRVGCPPGQVAVVGDQIFTDVLGGRILGMQTILVPGLSGPPRHPVRRMVRALEARILSRSSLPPSPAGGLP